MCERGRDGGEDEGGMYGREDERAREGRKREGGMDGCMEGRMSERGRDGGEDEGGRDVWRGR